MSKKILPDGKEQQEISAAQNEKISLENISERILMGEKDSKEGSNAEQPNSSILGNKILSEVKESNEGKLLSDEAIPVLAHKIEESNLEDPVSEAKTSETHRYDDILVSI